MADSKNVLEATDNQFQNQVLESDKLALVDFWAEWCGPCRQLAPTIDKIADNFEGKVKVLKMNVDENPNTPTRYSVRGIPTLIFFKNGEAIDQLVGNQTEESIQQLIEKHM